VINDQQNNKNIDTPTPKKSPLQAGIFYNYTVEYNYETAAKIQNLKSVPAKGKLV
jgi:hypothetical protein